VLEVLSVSQVPLMNDRVPPMSYYDWLDKQITCKGCGWSGHGRDMTVGESFEGGAERHCPKCGEYYGFVAYPMRAEVLSDPRAQDVDRMVAGVQSDRIDRFNRDKLTGPDQLPDLNPPPTTLVWDVTEPVGPSGEEFVVIRHGEREIWRELSWYENYERFGAIARILYLKYGETLRDLVPTRKSHFDLYGDRMSAPRYVERIRHALANRQDPLRG